jgi:copper chaperone
LTVLSTNGDQNTPTSEKEVPIMDKKTETIRIEGMSCGHCVKSVKGALEELEGVSVEEVDLGGARVRYDPARIDRNAIARAIEEAGYTPRLNAETA